MLQAAPPHVFVVQRSGCVGKKHFVARWALATITQVAHTHVPPERFAVGIYRLANVASILSALLAVHIVLSVLGSVQKLFAAKLARITHECVT